MGEVIYLTYIAALLVLGVFASVISNKMKVSKYAVLLVLGIILSYIRIGGFSISDFNNTTFLLSISILTLVMIVFDGSSRFTLKELDNFYSQAIKLALSFLFLSVIIITPSVYFLFSLDNILFAFFFAILMSGTDPTAIFGLLADKDSRVLKMLSIESILNTPIIVIGSFLVLDMINIGLGEYNNWINSASSLMLQIVVGLGTGIFIGIIFFKNMRKFYDEQISSLALIAASLLTYILAESLGGNGVLSVATLGLFFGNVYIKQKDQLQEFSSTLSKSLEIIVFLMIGIILQLNLELIFFLKSLVLFAIFLLVRYIAVSITFYHDGFNRKEMIFMSLNIPKGLAVAVILLTIALQGNEAMRPVLDVSILFMIYTLILSSFMPKFAKRFK